MSSKVRLRVTEHTTTDDIWCEIQTIGSCVGPNIWLGDIDSFRSMLSDRYPDTHEIAEEVWS